MITSPSDKVTIAFLYWGFQPMYLPTRFCFLGRWQVFTFVTFTLNKYSIADLNQGLYLVKIIDEEHHEKTLKLIKQ